MVETIIGVLLAVCVIVILDEAIKYGKSRK